MIKNHIPGIVIFTSTMMVANVIPTLAKPVTYDFTVTVTQGSLAGNVYTGSLSYNAEQITGVGTEELGVQEGLTVKMNYFDRDFTEVDDKDYPQFPKLTLEAGDVKQLDFWVQSNERSIWWNQQGWEVELSPRRANY